MDNSEDEAELYAVCDLISLHVAIWKGGHCFRKCLPRTWPVSVMFTVAVLKYCEGIETSVSLMFAGWTCSVDSLCSACVATLKKCFSFFSHGASGSELKAFKCYGDELHVSCKACLNLDSSTPIPPFLQAMSSSVCLFVHVCVRGWTSLKLCQLYPVMLHF